MGKFLKLRFLLRCGSLLIGTLVCASAGFSATGRVGVFNNGDYDYRIVELPAGGLLSNAWIKFKSVPADLRPDEAGCYCFSETDPRFSYVQVYYQGTKELQFFDEALHRQGLAPLKKVVVTMKKVTGNLTPGGITLGGAVTYYYMPGAPLDETLFAHELGHILHLSFTGDVYYFNNPSEETSIMGVREGMANILSALFTGESKIGLISYGDGLRDVNRFFHFPDRIFTLRDDEERVRNSRFIRESYPSAYESEQTRPVLQLDQNQAEPYGSSSLFTQPLWLASIKFGREAILDMIISSIRAKAVQKSYPALAHDLIEAAGRNPEMKIFLLEEFRQRGLLDPEVKVL